MPSSVGTILSACVIFVLAAFAPWALMYLIAADAESAYVAHQLRTSTAAAIGEGRRALKDASAKNKASSNGAGGNGPGNGRPRPQSGGGNGGGGGGQGPRLTPSSGGPSAASGQQGSSEGQEVVDGTLALSGEAVGAGSVGAAAGLSAQSFGDLAIAASTGAGTVGGGGDLKASGREGSEARGRDRREPGKERSWPGETAGGAAAPLLPQRDSGSAGNTLQPPQKPEDETPATPRPSRPARGEGPVLSGAGASGGPRRRPPKAPSTGKGRGFGRDGERDS